MKHQSSKLVVAILSAVSTAAMAADPAPTPAATAAGAPTFEIKVTGTIKPGSCTPQQATLAYKLDDLTPSGLNNTDVTMLPGKSNNISITCTADTAIALSATSSSNIGTPYKQDINNHKAGFSSHKGYLYDLVDSSTNKRVGVYGFQFRNFKYQGGGQTSALSPAVVVTSADKASWSTDSNLNNWDVAQLKNDGTSYVSFADPGAAGKPVLASLYQGEILVAPTISPKQELTLTGELAFQGSTTITLSYL
ncbi:DUF1120 domain-containing protein [Burkholderia gladioli]|uniref:DUF1120 domain-containing protein n=1 Tax=Burkholderia gladioli TaxID=28095 RepID=UPI00163FCF08|nr:DUF1120 domain-containing protein [Burkholderia gladioli]